MAAAAPTVEGVAEVAAAAAAEAAAEVEAEVLARATVAGAGEVVDQGGVSYLQ